MKTTQLSGSCHCGAVQVHIPFAPKEVINCNCSMCRRVGALWGYFDIATVSFDGHPEHTTGYVQGDKTLRTLRCKVCGCVTHWEPLESRDGHKVGVNIRNFDPEQIGDVRIRLLDGADTWKSFYWEDIAHLPSRKG